MLLSKKNRLYNFWLIWFSCVLIVVVIQSITIDVAPYLHKDEFLIVDLGRIILFPQTDWAITWLTKVDSPVLLTSYLGPVFQELSFRIIGELGPRISGLAGAILASASMIFYLLARGTTKIAALVLSLIFLLDPLFVQSYTMGRVDGWAIASCITACCVLASSDHSLSNKQIKFRLFIAGALGVFGFFIWPSSIFLFPLIAYELTLLCLKQQKPLIPLFWFTTGGILTTILIISPIAVRIAEQFSQMIDGLAVNVNSGPEGSAPIMQRYYTSLLELFRVLKFTPLLVLFAVFGLILKKEIGLLLVSFLTVLSIVITVVYNHRLIYLLPYLIVSVALFYKSSALIHKPKEYNFFRSHLPLVILLVWSVGLSVGLRTVLAVNEMAERDRNLIFKAAKSMIGNGNHTVLTTSNEFYYSGRTLGWKMYAPYLSVAQPASFTQIMKILHRVDFVILQAHYPNENFEKALKIQGFKIQNVYHIYNTVKKDDGVQTNVKRMRNLYSIFQKPYGPYTLYVRDTKTVYSSNR